MLVGCGSQPSDSDAVSSAADGDTYSKALEGREVYLDPNNPEILYLYELCYWAQGEYPAYLPCPILP